MLRYIEHYGVTCSGINSLYETLLFIDNTPSHPRALMEMYSVIGIVFKPANICSAMDQAVILTLKSYYLRNTLYEAIVAVDSDSSEGSEQGKLERFHHFRFH